MATVNVDLSCTGTGSSTITSSPSTNLNASGTSVPKLVKSPIRSLSAVGTIVPRLLKLPQRTLSTIATHGIIISLLRFGIDTFDIVEGKRKWFVTQGGKWTANGIKRFTFLVRGKPSA